MIFNLFLFIILLTFSAFFSGSETAFFSLGRVRLRRLQEKHRRAKIIKNFLGRPTHLLSTIVFGNMLVNISFSSLATAIFVKYYGDRGLIPAILISGISILFFGEIFPKTLAIYSAEKLSLFSAPLISIFSKVFFPAIFAIEKIVSLPTRYFLSYRKVVYDAEELRTAILLSRKQGHISAEEEAMISYVLEFKETPVSQILTGRAEIKGIDAKSTQEEALGILKNARHSKAPVFKDSLDNIEGILYAKDLFLRPASDYKTLLRPPIFVLESKKISDLLRIFLEKNERIAVVLDARGTASGIVTLEDIQEEIFGEIYGELEVPRASAEKIDENTFRARGKVPIKALNAELNLYLPEEEGTLGGFLLSHMGKIPRVGEKFRTKVNVPEGSKNIEFTIEKATTKNITSIIITISR